MQFSSGVVPTAGSAIRFSNVTTSGFDINWGPASDSIDPPSSLQYRVVKASTYSAIQTLIATNSFPSSGIVQDWTKGLTSASISGLAAGDIGYYSVLIKNSRGIISSYPPVPRVAGKMIFISHSGINSSNLLGINGMDALCQSTADPSADQNAILTAIISDGSDRIACTFANCSANGASENVNWPLQPNTTYYNTQGQLIGTPSDAGIFTSNLTNPIVNSLVVVTGLQPDWTSNSNNCLGWTSSASGQFSVGHASETTISSLFQYPTETIKNCTNLASESYRIFCVEN